MCNIIMCLYYIALCVCVWLMDSVQLCKQKVFVSEVSLVPAGLYMCIYALNVLCMYYYYVRSWSCEIRQEGGREGKRGGGRGGEVGEEYTRDV